LLASASRDVRPRSLLAGPSRRLLVHVVAVVVAAGCVMLRRVSPTHAAVDGPDLLALVAFGATLASTLALTADLEVLRAIRGHARRAERDAESVPYVCTS